MRLLERSRPRVHVFEAIVLTLPAERAGARPRLDDEVVCLTEAFQARGGVHREVVVLRPDAAHETADHPAAADDVHHRDLLCDAQRVVAQRRRVAEDGDLRAVRAGDEVGGDDVGRGHEAVGGLVVLVDGDGVEAELLRVDELREVLLVDLGAASGVEVSVGVGDPRGALALERLVEVRPGHEVEVDELHGAHALRWTLVERWVVGRDCLALPPVFVVMLSGAPRFSAQHPLRERSGTTGRLPRDSSAPLRSARNDNS